MSAVIVIPARHGSTRFPGKPLAMIRGKTVLERTWRIARAVERVDQVYVATDDSRLRDAAEGFGAKVLLTRPDCRNGSERVFEAARRLPQTPEIIVNLQGDAALTPPWVIQSVVDAMAGDPSLQLATPASHLTWEQFDALAAAKAAGRVSGTTVVFDSKQNALYFSKGLIPFVRNRSWAAPPLHHHIGLYAYRYKTLERYAALPPTPLEETEGLEQLRALENGMPIKVILVDYRGRTHWSIDNPEDVAIAEEIIAREGELL